MPGIATTFIIYGVPVYINFDTSVFLKLNATLDGNAKAGFNYKFNTEFKAGCKYDNSWSLIKSGSINKNKLDFINPAADVEAKAGVGLMLGVDVIIDKLAGPSLAVGPQTTIAEYPEKK